MFLATCLHTSGRLMAARASSLQLCHLFSTATAAASAAAAASGSSVAVDAPMLYRDFIQESLYHPAVGYFNRPSPPIRRLSAPIRFNRLLNQAEYRMVLAQTYQQLQVDWLTPVEVFAPWYGRAIAHYMLEMRQHGGVGSSSPLAVVEVGGGTGTLAASILDYVSERDPVAYSSMSYTTIEISDTLAAMQQHLIVKEGGHGQAWRLVRGDASQASTWLQASSRLPKQHSLQQQHCFVLMMEVMDNLPHDRVIRQSADSPWQQVMVSTVAAADEAQQQQQHHHHHHQNGSSSRHHRSLQQQQQQQYMELLQPAEDPLIQRCLAALYPPAAANASSSSSSGGGGSNDSSGSSGSSKVVSWLQSVLGLEDAQAEPCDVWLPTRCLQLLETLHAAAPHHTLIAADFDALPDIKVPGRNAPLVSGRPGGGVVQDYDTVLVPWGAADIFFPTDFDGLAALYASAAAAGAGAGASRTAAGSTSSSSSSTGRAVDARLTQQQQHQAGKVVTQQQQQQQQQQQSGHVVSQRVLSCSHSSTGDFMSAFAEAKHTQTLTGYNPLVQDWQNTRVFVGQSAGQPAV